LPVLCALGGLLVAGALVGQSGGSSPAGARPAALPSAVPAVALASSWFCAGATESPDSVASGQLLFENASQRDVTGSVELVSQYGYQTTQSVSVPAGSTTTLAEALPGLTGSNSNHWVGAIVTLYGGDVSVSQVVTTTRGSASQPCATSAAPQWYFAYGATLRNAWDEISLLNPYPMTAIVDLSFTTDEGREQPLAYQGVLVRADGMTLLNLGNHLRRRQHIAVTVTARVGEVVAYQTEIVTPPPAGAAPIGTPGTVNPVVPVPGITLTLGTARPATSLWWPTGGEGPGVTETYAVYNPGPLPARLTLSLFSGAPDASPGSSSQFTVAGYGSTLVTTNDQPWALPGVSYAAHLQSSNGTAVVAERFVMTSPPAAERGLALLMGQTRPSDEWLVTGGLNGGNSFLRGQVFLGQVSLEMVDPGPRAAVVSLDGFTGGKLAPLPGFSGLALTPDHRTGWQVPDVLAGVALVVVSSRPILLEQDWYSLSPSVGTNLAPATALSSP
jgi:hypothetical protein